jgi:ABC-type nitrate/sulfonate/bicarbonate transport system ATPase subunit
VFVTHDLAEAVTLGDRVIMFTGLPGRLKAVYWLNEAGHVRDLEAENLPYDLRHRHLPADLVRSGGETQ